MLDDYNNSGSKNNDNSALMSLLNKKRKNPEVVEDQDDLLKNITKIIFETEDISNTKIIKKKKNKSRN